MELPIEAKKQLNLISTLNAIAGQNTSNNRPRTASPSLINIRF